MPVHDTTNRPRRTGYSFSNQGAAASANTGASVGKHVLRRVMGVDFWGPSWGEETVIRIFPATNPDNRTQFDTYRLSSSYCDFGDWIRVYEAVRNFGNPGVTMLLHNSLNPSYDAQLMNPCWILYRSINQALSQGQGLPEWVPLTKGGPGKGAVLAKPSKLYLVQCAIFRHKSKDTFGPGKPPLGASPDGPTIVMGLPPTAGETLIQLLEEKDEDWKGVADDPNQYKYGDIVSIDQGGFVHIFELGKDPRARHNTVRQAPSLASVYTAAPKTAAGPAMEAKGYGVIVTKTLDGGDQDIPASLNGFEDLVKTKFRPWEDILEFKSDEEQAHLIAPLFPPSAVLYAWRDHPSWIPENVREAGNYEARKPVSSSQVASPWSGQSRQAPVLPSPVKQEADNVVPEGGIDDMAQTPVESLSVDPLIDDAARIEAARAKLEASSKRTKRGS